MVRLRHAFLVEVLAQRAEHAVTSRIFEVRSNDICGVGLCRRAREAELFSGPKADELVATRTRPEPNVLFMCEFALETFLALVERAPSVAPLLLRNLKFRAASRLA